MIAAVNDFLDDLRGGRMSEAPIVRVAQGALQGRIANAPSGKAYYSFQGIPYAKPPLGSLRFKAPQPPEPWEDVRDATVEGNVSAQVDQMAGRQYVGDENCLFLNVYTPRLEGPPLPVMVFIHGGGFSFGSGNTSLYGPDYLVEKDVVVVTVNYRLGPLGFLCLHTPEVPGNAGLKDMAQALRWIRDNVQGFGGDPANLTVFGESAGGVATSLLTASPLTRNLVSKAVIQSGTALHSWAFQSDPLYNARQLARSLGCDAEDIDGILEFLSTTPVKDIVEAASQTTEEDFIQKGAITFAPVVEREFPGVEAALSESFIDLLTSGRVAQVPVMIGSTALEFTEQRRAEDLQAFLPTALGLTRGGPEALAAEQRLHQLYLSGEERLGRAQLLSDLLINVDTHRYVQYLVKATNRPIYYYRFEYVGELNISKKLFPKLEEELKGALHADELGYLFNMELLRDVEPTPQDVKMRERMVRLWTNFAKVGNPTPDESHYLTVRWQPVSEGTGEELPCMRLASELALLPEPDGDRMAFWDDLYSKHFKIWNLSDQTTTTLPSTIEIVSYVQHQHSGSLVVEETIETLVQTMHETQQQVQTDPEPEVVPEPSVPELPSEPASQPEPEPVAAPTVVDAPHAPEPAPLNGVKESQVNGTHDRKPRTSNEIKMVQNSNGHPKDVIRANDPPEDDLPKNIGVNKFVNFFESLGGKK
ncbi:PREDICTED: juvenile hormone esterase-like isoform X1 [Papilio xuthus]|uniref:Juvenile hormone esterase-like isoform X1 n=2 Tax=Papilio xuthus TaxID=66420 RepID=A0AAJ7EGI0_PAPXU|nr:PREDICTED: juvenile hormone esterase-like isoform X1 [Papilio xuthus]XP_013176489.1 PREDICTED: juvenile hormone esterase-like isoform X1 [Papilio xuthus]